MGNVPDLEGSRLSSQKENHIGKVGRTSSQSGSTTRVEEEYSWEDNEGNISCVTLSVSTFLAHTRLNVTCSNLGKAIDAEIRPGDD